MIDRLGLGDDLLRLRVGERARVGELREIARDTVSRFLIDSSAPTKTTTQLAAFVALADRHDLDARRRRRQRAVVLQDVGVVGQLLRRADVVAEHVLGRRDAGHFGQVIDQRAHELRPGRPFLDRAGEVRIVVRPTAFFPVDCATIPSARRRQQGERRREAVQGVPTET